MARLSVRLTPRGGRDAIDGWMRDGAGRAALKVRVSAPPADGEANAALVALIAKALNSPRSAVRIVSGDTARVKQLEVDGVDEARLAEVFGGALTPLEVRRPDAPSVSGCAWATSPASLRCAGEEKKECAPPQSGGAVGAAD